MLIVLIFETSIHAAYMLLRTCAAARPDGVCSEPMRTRSGWRISLMAVPSARNSGFESMSKGTPGR